MDSFFPSDARPSRAASLSVGTALIVLGTIGWVAAFTLTVEKFHLLANPKTTLSCDLSVLVQCQRNLTSWQGELFGFPNPLIGVAGWIVPTTVGVAMLAGARFARWFWWLMMVGMVGALALVVFLIGQSIFVLSTLCPWCMITWAATIPTFWLVLLHGLRESFASADSRVGRVARIGVGYVPLLSLLSFAAIGVLAQWRLDVLSYL